MNRVLITDYVHQRLIEGLTALGYVVDYQPDITYDQTLSIIKDYQGLVINSKIKCDEKFLTPALSLHWIARLGSGMEVIDTAACDSRGIRYFNSPEGNRIAVAEHTLGLLLAMMRHIPRSNAQVHDAQWIREPNRGSELSGRTIGLIGYGHTGTAFAKLLTGFEVRVLAYDKYKTDFTADHVVQSTLDEICTHADVISLHLPLNPETRYMIDDTFFAKLKRPIYFINVSRGGVLDTMALLRAIDNGIVTAAALDVLENEKLTTLSPIDRIWWDILVHDPRIILTPHIAGWTHESLLRIAEVVLEKVGHLK